MRVVRRPAWPFSSLPAWIQSQWPQDDLGWVQDEEFVLPPPCWLVSSQPAVQGQVAWPQDENFRYAVDEDFYLSPTIRTRYRLPLLASEVQGANVPAIPFEEDQYLNPIQWPILTTSPLTADDEIVPPTPLSLEDDVFLPRVVWPTIATSPSTADDEITTQTLAPDEDFWSVNLYRSYQVPVQAFFDDDIWPQSAFTDDPLFYLVSRGYLPPLQAAADVDDVPNLIYATDEEVYLSPLPWLIKTWPAVMDDEVWPTPGLMEEEYWQNPVFPVPLSFFLMYGLGRDDEVYFTPAPSVGKRQHKTVMGVG